MAGELVQHDREKQGGKEELGAGLPVSMGARAAVGSLAEELLMDGPNAQRSAAAAKPSFAVGTGGCVEAGEEVDCEDPTRDPITFEVMLDPVLALDGWTYDRCSLPQTP